MAEASVSLSWSSQFSLAPPSQTPGNLLGDKIILPPTALEQLLSAATVTSTPAQQSEAHFDPFNPYSVAAARQSQTRWQDTQQQLPHPLTFRLVNPANGNVVHAGIREFSASEGQVGLSPFLREALGLKEVKEKEQGPEGHSDNPIDLTDLAEPNDEEQKILVHAKQLPKGTYVRLRPLEAGYNPDDWKALLERHLRDSFTTLTNGEILTVPGRGGKEEFRFLIDKFLPEGDGICVVDTDLEVDIEALNEEQARETLRQIMKKSQRAPGTAEGSSAGGDVDIWKAVSGQVVPGEYVDYRLSSWDHSRGIDIELNTEEGDVALLVSPFSSRQRARPRIDEHIFGAFGEENIKRLELQPTNIELEGAEALYLTVHSVLVDSQTEDVRPRPFSLRVKILEKAPTAINLDLDTETTLQAAGPDEEQCKNCLQLVPKRTMMLHENFCLRNNILCPHCKNVFKKNSDEWKDHWHCPHDSSYGNTAVSKSSHDRIFHVSQTCPNCSYTASSLLDLASHRTTLCPGKIILCQFCHLEVPQEGDPSDPSPEVLISGLTAHELADGARTTECHLCSKIIRLRDMATHLKHHDLERQNRPSPRFCRNANCGRTLDGVGKNGDIGAASRMGNGPGNDLGLCSICFGPLYVSMHDPEGKAMKRRVERRYISQLIQGCGKSWCTNEYCKTGKKNIGNEGPVIGTKEALPLVKPLVEALPDHRNHMYFCTDEGSQKRRKLAEMLAAEDSYEMGWCIAACEAASGRLDEARQWLQHWAPSKAESRRS
jgi:hypothetical protein